MSTQVCNSLKAIHNASRKDEREVLIRPSSSKVIRFLQVMLKRGYIDGFTKVDDKKRGKICVELNGRMNKCKGISPMYSIKLKEIDKFKNTMLPSLDTGYMVLTTRKGIMDHYDAIKNKVGGRILGVIF